MSLIWHNPELLTRIPNVNEHNAERMTGADDPYKGAVSPIILIDISLLFIVQERIPKRRLKTDLSQHQNKPRFELIGL